MARELPAWVPVPDWPYQIKVQGTPIVVRSLVRYTQGRRVGGKTIATFDGQVRLYKSSPDGTLQRCRSLRRLREEAVEAYLARRPAP